MLPQNIISSLPVMPVAYLTIDGLAVCCFNRRDKKWEVAFLRQVAPEHQLKIDVTQEGLLGGGVKDIYAGDILSNVRNLEFRVENGSQVQYDFFNGGYFFLPGDFSRSGPHTNDFRWTIDFIGRGMPHGRFEKLITKSEQRNRIDVTLATIPNSLFYTKSVCDDSVILAPLDTSPDDPNAINFGSDNEALGAFIFADRPGAIQIIKDGGQPLNLPYNPGRIYHISLMNMDIRHPKNTAADIRKRKGPYVQGDFRFYYEVIEVSGNKYDLWAPSRVIRSEDGDCHPTVVGLDPSAGGPDSLMPLIT